jgi:hypothetical protein
MSSREPAQHRTPGRNHAQVPPGRQPGIDEPARFRLLHRGVIVGIDGPSYRMRAHQQRADTIRKAVTAGTKR